MKNLGINFTEYYQHGKYLGSVNQDGVLDDNQVGYFNRTFKTSGEINLKKRHKATTENPIMEIRYNMQGRLETT
jgi:hypothetical protein